MAASFLTGKSLAAATMAVLTLVIGCGTGRGVNATISPAPGHTTSAQARLASRGPAAPATALTKRANFLTSVSCVSVSVCVAVGSYYSAATGPRKTLAASWEGRGWRAEFPPSRGRDSQLTSVSCTAPMACVAVGLPAVARTPKGWSVTTGAGAVSSVSCAQAHFCMAVGVQPPRRLAAARFDGRGWRVESMPGPLRAPDDITLAGISCTSASFCVAVGDATSGATARPSPRFRDRTLAEAWNGSRWRAEYPPSPSRQSELSGVSCTSPQFCIAVGASGSGQRALAERWNGTSWSVQRTPSVSGTGYTALTAVSCYTAVSCTAVGTYDVGAFGIAEHWNGHDWALERLPSPTGQPGVDPVGVSCASATACIAVGTSAAETLAEAWNGTVWTVEPTPDPA